MGRRRLAREARLASSSQGSWLEEGESHVSAGSSPALLVRLPNTCHGFRDPASEAGLRCDLMLTEQAQIVYMRAAVVRAASRARPRR